MLFRDRSNIREQADTEETSGATASKGFSDNETPSTTDEKPAIIPDNPLSSGPAGCAERRPRTVIMKRGPGVYGPWYIARWGF
jgi:hypothetical protein